MPVGWFDNSTLHSDYAPVTNLSVTCIQATAGVIHPRSPSAWSSYVTAGIGGGRQGRPTAAATPLVHRGQFVQRDVRDRSAWRQRRLGGPRRERHVPLAHVLGSAPGYPDRGGPQLNAVPR